MPDTDNAPWLQDYEADTAEGRCVKSNMELAYKRLCELRRLIGKPEPRSVEEAMVIICTEWLAFFETTGGIEGAKARMQAMMGEPDDGVPPIKH